MPLPQKLQGCLSNGAMATTGRLEQLIPLVEKNCIASHTATCAKSTRAIRCRQQRLSTKHFFGSWIKIEFAGRIARIFSAIAANSDAPLPV